MVRKVKFFDKFALELGKRRPSRIFIAGERHLVMDRKLDISHDLGNFTFGLLFQSQAAEGIENYREPLFNRIQAIHPKTPEQGQVISTTIGSVVLADEFRAEVLREKLAGVEVVIIDGNTGRPAAPGVVSAEHTWAILNGAVCPYPGWVSFEYGAGLHQPYENS